MIVLPLYYRRNNLLPGLSLGDLTGHVMEFAEDQHGSRFIQQKLETAGKQEKENIFKVKRFKNLLTSQVRSLVLANYTTLTLDEEKK